MRVSTQSNRRDYKIGWATPARVIASDWTVEVSYCTCTYRACHVVVFHRGSGVVSRIPARRWSCDLANSRLLWSMEQYVHERALTLMRPTSKTLLEERSAHRNSRVPPLLGFSQKSMRPADHGKTDCAIAVAQTSFAQRIPCGCWPSFRAQRKNPSCGQLESSPTKKS